MRTCSVLLVIVLLASVLGCKKSVTEPSSSPLDVKTGIDTISISITASNYSFFMNQVAPFRSDTVEVQVVVNSYGGGNGEFKLLDSTNHAFIIESLNLIGTGSARVTQRPYTFSVGFDKWTGDAQVRAIGH